MGVFLFIGTLLHMLNNDEILYPDAAPHTSLIHETAPHTGLIHYKAIVAYDGTDYSGWQIQIGGNITVASVLNDAFYKVFLKRINITGSSRTDAGVHALGQVCHFAVDLDLDPEIMRVAWSYRLPPGVFIRSLEKVPEYFNPRLNVDYKIYYYHIFLAKPLPMIARYGWICNFIRAVDLKKFSQSLALYEGTHDFRSFCKMDPTDTRSTVRTVYSVKLDTIKKYNALRVTIVGKSFLQYQIRRMVGYALDVGRRKEYPFDFIKSILDTPNSQQPLVKAESSGLMLRKIVYNRESDDE
jgi:tRNA pseudouridine38-40 synthase